jgi:MSHA biogenesis protein MshM
MANVPRIPPQSRPERSADWGYTRHFGLREAPFTNTPDSRFFFAHDSCQIALNTLMVATRSGEGFIKITGEVGTGKTLLCRKFLGVLDENFITAYIPNPYLEPMTLLLAIADELGISYPEHVNQHQLLKAFTNFLIETYAQYRGTVVLCLDEAHAMPTETLEVLRLLSNLETPRRKLMQLVLFGQPELDRHLEQSSIRQLKQRISFSASLGAMTRSNLEDYIQHRLRIAGYLGPRLFSTQAVRRLYKASRGIPRLINILAHKALLAAFGEGARYVNGRHVRLAVADTESLHTPAARRRGWLPYAAALLGATAASLAAQVWGKSS